MAPFCVPSLEQAAGLGPTKYRSDKRTLSGAAVFYALDILMQLHAGFVLKGWDEKRQGELQAQLWVVATDVARLWLLLRVLTPPNTCH